MRKDKKHIYSICMKLRSVNECSFNTFSGNS